MCLLIIGLVVTGCGSSSGSHNDPQIIGVMSPNGVVPSSGAYSSSNMNNYVEDERGNITVTLTGSNFGSSQDDSVVYYNGYKTASGGIPQKVALSFVNGGTWSSSQISVLLYKATREDFPYGSFTVVVYGNESATTPIYNFGSSNLNNATVTSVNPTTVYSYSTEHNYITIEGSGFGTTPMDMLIYTYNGYNKTISRGEIYNWNDNRIVMPLPVNDMSNSITSNTTLFIKPINSSSTSTLANNLAAIEYRVSQITYVSPAEGSIGKTITINGQGFGATQGNVYMYVGESYANVISGTWSDNGFQARIPSFNTPGSKNIKLRMNGTDITSNFSYEVKAPLLYSITKTEDLAGGDAVTLYGNYFSNPADLQAIYQTGRIEITCAGSNSTNVISMTDAGVTWNDNSITFTWPRISSSFLSTKTFTITVIVGSLTSTNTLTVTD